MAIAEQMLDTFQQLQVQGARIAALEAQLQIESARAQTAEKERSALIQTLVTIRQERAGGIVETKGISQPFTLIGGAEQDFGEWTHKVRTFMLARFGDQILGALTWASRQRKIVVKACGPSQRETASYLGSMSLENKATTRTRSTRSRISRRLHATCWGLYTWLFICGDKRFRNAFQLTLTAISLDVVRHAGALRDWWRWLADTL